jgi:hypothetical protein
MEKIIDKVISDAVQGSCLYSHRDSTWLVFPEKKEWIITLYDKNGYLWYNHDFFRNLFLYLDISVGDNNPHIKRWVENNLGLKVGDNCHPDYLPGEYDWRGDFDCHEVIREGVKL